MESQANFSNLELTAEEQQLLAEYGTSSIYDSFLGLTSGSHSSSSTAFLTGTGNQTTDEDELSVERLCHLPLSLILEELTRSSALPREFGADGFLSAAEAIRQRSESGTAQREQARRRRLAKGRGTKASSDGSTSDYRRELETLVQRAISAPTVSDDEPNESDSTLDRDVDLEARWLLQDLEELKERCEETDRVIADTSYRVPDPDFVARLEAELQIQAETREDDPINNPDLEDPSEFLPQEELESLLKDHASRTDAPPTGEWLSEQERDEIENQFRGEAAALHLRHQALQEQYANQSVTFHKSTRELLVEFEESLRAAGACVPTLDFDRLLGTGLELAPVPIEDESLPEVLLPLAQGSGPTAFVQPIRLPEVTLQVESELTRLVSALLPTEIEWTTPTPGADHPRQIAQSGDGTQIGNSHNHSRGPLQKAKNGRAAMERSRVLEQQEAQERKLMRIADVESAKVEKENIRRLEAMDREVEQFLLEEERMRKTNFTSEAIGRCDIASKESRQRDSILQWLRHQVAQRMSADSKNIQSSESSLRTSIVEMEDRGWNDMMLQWDEERRIIADRIQVEKEAARQSRRTFIRQRREKLKEDYSSAMSSAAQKAKSLLLAALNPVDDGSTTHAALVAHKYEVMRTDREVFVAATESPWMESVHWSHQNKKDWAGTLRDTLVELEVETGKLKSSAMAGERQMKGTDLSKRNQLLRATTSNARLDALREEEKGSASSAPRSNAAVLALTAQVLQNHHPYLFKLSRQDRMFAYAGRMLSVTLEGLKEIDYESCQKLHFSGAEGDLQTPSSGLMIGPVVQSLDLSSNAFQTTDLQRLFSAFPALRQLILNDNKIADLAPGEALSVPSLVSQLQLSMNRFTSLGFLRRRNGFSNLKSFKCHSNQLQSTEGIEGSPLLVEVELQRNEITQLHGISQLKLLRSIDVSRNRLSSSMCLAQCQMLERCFASGNKLESAWFSDEGENTTPRKPNPTTLPYRSSNPLLRELFLNENCLTRLWTTDSIPTSASAPSIQAPWHPLLTVLHLEGNKIQSLESLRCFHRLLSVKLAFNQIADPKQFLHLGGCKSMTDLSFTDNPCTMTPADRDTISGWLVVALPLLREIDNEAVKVEVRRAKEGEFCAENLCWQTQLTRLLRTPSWNLSESGLDFIASCYRGNAPRSIRARSEVLLRGLLKYHSQTTTVAAAIPLTDSPVTPAASNYGLLSFDHLLERVNTEAEALSLWVKRLHMDAVSFENHFLTYSKLKSGMPLDADGAEGSSRVPFKLDGKSAAQALDYGYYATGVHRIQGLQRLKEASSAQGKAPTRLLSYVLRRQTFAESKAAAKLRHWVAGIALIRRAKRERERRWKESAAFAQSRRLKAVLRIQPVWRGAVTRMRLAKVKGMFDGDEELAPVSWVDPAPSSGGRTLASLLHHTIQANPEAMQLLFTPKPGGPEPVPLQRVGSAPAPSTGARHLPFTPTSPPGSATGPARSTFASASAGPGRSPSGPPVPGEQPAGSDAEWGFALSAQLKKKEQKMDKQRKEHARKDFMADPLGYKKKHV